VNSPKTRSKSLKKFVRALLAATCLTVAGSGAAHAGTFLESSLGGGDFPNTSPGTSLPVGTTTVDGTISSYSDVDFFEFMNLAAGQSFTLTASASAGYMLIEAFDSGNTQIGSPQYFYSGVNGVISGTIPGDGMLIAEILNSEGGGAYSVSLDAPLSGVPEPATAGLTVLGLAAAALAARRRKTED